MAWQEELRKLDEDLASGNLSADEYRARRDQILSSAVSSGEAQVPQSNEKGDSTQIIQPLSPPQGQPQQTGPGQPQQQPAQQQPEATHVVRNDPGPERTQVVQGWQSQSPQPASPPAGFQPPQHGTAPSPPGGFPVQHPQQQAQQPWNAPQDDVSPPWGGSDLPPMTPPADSGWGVHQGPEGFESKPSSGKGRKIAMSAAAFVVVVGLGVAIWALFIRDGAEDPLPPVAQPTSEPGSTNVPSSALPEPPPAKPAPADNEEALIEPPGEERGGGGTFDLTRLSGSKLLPETVVEALEQGGMTEGLLLATSEDQSTIGMFSLAVEDEQAAVNVAREYANAQQSGGIPANDELSMQGVPVFSNGPKSDTSVFRAVYVLYDRVVIVETYGPDRDAVQQQFKNLLDEQVEHTPPTTRNP